MTLKPWREVIHPHDDVLDGKFDESELAADLTKVVRGIAKPEYQDPERFFERTVITGGMNLLLQSVVKRLGGKGGDPVVQLQTAFGGGKTHTRMAVMHVASGAVPAAKMLGVSDVLDKAKVKELVKARIAVLDGNELAPSQPQEHGKVRRRRMHAAIAGFDVGLGAERGRIEQGRRRSAGRRLGVSASAQGHAWGDDWRWACVQALPRHGGDHPA